MENDVPNKKLYELEKKRDLLMAQISNMKDEISVIEHVKLENLQNREKLSILFDKGVIDKTGEYIGMK